MPKLRKPKYPAEVRKEAFPTSILPHVLKAGSDDSYAVFTQTARKKEKTLYTCFGSEVILSETSALSSSARYPH